MARILVVDDAAFMRKVLSDALASGGHELAGEDFVVKPFQAQRVLEAIEKALA